LRYENLLYSECQDTPDSNVLSFYRIKDSVKNNELNLGRNMLKLYQLNQI